MGKKQHYVPRMILWRFANDENQKLINIFLINRDSFINNAALKNQAYGNNIYGTDQILEKFFSKIESINTQVINKLMQDEIVLSEKDRVDLNYFISYQLSRTKYAVTKINEMLDKMAKTLASGDKKLRKYEDKYKVKFTEPYKFLFSIATETAIFLSDLRLAMLNNNSDISFIIGENPVIVLNPYLVEKNWIGSSNGLAVYGTMLYFPISPKRAILLYDKNTYSIKKENGFVFPSTKDVNNLNCAQMACSADCVYYKKEEIEIPFSWYRDITKEYRESDKMRQELYEIKDRDLRRKRKKETLLMTGSVDLPIAQNFSFFNYKYLAIMKDLSPSMDIMRENLKIYDQMIREKRKKMENIPT